MGTNLHPYRRVGSDDAHSERLGVPNAQEETGSSRPNQRVIKQDIFSLLDGFAY
jgi:hypothetical protein